MRAGKAGAWAVVVVTAALIAAFHWQQWSSTPLNLAVVFYVAVAGMLIWLLAASARRRSFAHLPVADGRVVAIVPAYNEDPETLYACVRSLALQTRPPEQIIVVDDGSAEPVVPIDIPTVTWYWQENAGKRPAQMVGLMRARAAEWADYVVTVDSDSVVAPDGIEQLLRAMSNTDVQAATGTCLVRNRTESIWTRLQDLEINLGNMVMRRARSAVGAVTPTTGALSVYRASILWDNAEDYLTEGTFGDDRRLCHYSLQRGQVVAVDEAVVESGMPSTYRATLRQRTRWFKGYWRYLPYELERFSGWPLALRCWSIVLQTMYPLIVGFAFAVWPLVAGHVYWEIVFYWMALLYTQTVLYLERPAMTLGARLSAWLLLTPLLVIYQAVLIRPSLYYAITQVRDRGWATRTVGRQRGRYRLEGATA